MSPPAARTFRGGGVGERTMLVFSFGFFMNDYLKLNSVFKTNGIILKYKK